MIQFASDPPAVWDRYDSYGGKLAFDIGANGGLLANRLSVRFLTVIACEPAWESYTHLLGCHQANVIPLNVAVSDHAGTVRLAIRTGALAIGELVTGDSMVDDWGEYVGERAVPSVTLDDLTGQYGRPQFVKIDTEGHEWPILLGGVETFAQPLQFVIEIHSRTAGEQIEQWLTEREHLWYTIPDTRPTVDHYWIVSGDDHRI